MNLLENDILEHLHRLSSTVSFLTDSTEVFRQSREALKKLVPSEEILIFFDDRERESLVAPGAFNLHPRNISDEVVIPYDSPIAREVLISRQSMKRFAPETPLLPSIQSELFVPIISPEGVLGCLYFARKERAPFTLSETKLAEHISGFIEISIERLKWEERWQRSKKITERWQEKYLAMLDAIPFPALVLHLETDSISEVNEEFLKLTEIDRSTLFDKKFSEVCHAGDIVQRLKLNNPIARDVAEIVNVHGERLKVDAHFSRLETVSASDYLVIFQPIWSVDAHPADIDWLPKFLKACDLAQRSDSLYDRLLRPVEIIFEKFEAVYVTLQIPSVSEDLVQKISYHYANGTISQPEDYIAAGLNEGPTNAVLKSKQITSVDDITREPSFVDWLPVARRIGYQSFASIPISYGDRNLGILNVFCHDPRAWQPQELQTLSDMAHILSYLIQDHQHIEALKEREQKITALEEITKTVNSSLELEAVLRIAAAEMKKIIDFDYVAFTLFDMSGTETRVFDLAVQEVVRKLGPNWSWDEIEHTGLGWIRRAIPEMAEIQTLQPARPEGMPTSMPAHTSVLLLSRDNYLGNCSLGRLSDRPFTRKDVLFLRQIAGQIAIAIENARLFQQIEQRYKEISALAQASHSITQSLKIEDILDNTCKAAKKALKATLCTVTLFYEASDAIELFDWLPQSLRSAINSKRMHQFIDKLEKKGVPATFDTPDKFVHELCKTKLQEEQLALYRPFVITPIVHNRRLLASIVTAWDVMRPIQESDLEILTTLAGQARSALLNANLYRKSLQNAEELENFVYSVSHDLKSPIQSIRSYAALIREEYDKILPDGALAYLKRLSANLDQMEKLIMDLLELSRVGRGKTKFKDEDVATIVDQAMQSISGIIEKKDIEFKIDKNLPRIHCNKTGLVQVFSNLLSNAIKFTKSVPEPIIEIGFKELRSFYEFYVKDNGVGIPPELHEKIFELFHTKSDEEDMSTGVGLAIVKKVIEMHHGKVWVESQPGEGAVFKFTIPKKHTFSDFPHNGFTWSPLKNSQANLE